MTDTPTIGQELATRMAQFNAALPAQIKPEKFARVVLTAIQNTPKLVQMDRASLWNACMRAAQDGLLPDGRDGALVPFRGKVQWMVMIGGLRKKVRNSEEIATWEVHAVHAKDEFDYELGDDPFIKHKPFIEGDPGPLIAVYSVAVLKSGEKTREVMTRAEIEYVRDTYAQTDGEGAFSPAWRKSFDEMAKKTVARRHAKVLPMSTDLEELVRRDDNEDIDRVTERRVREPKQTLTEKLEALTKVDPETGEITEDEITESGEGRATSVAPDGAGAAVVPPSQAAPVTPTEAPEPAQTVSAPQRAPRAPRRSEAAQERLQAAGDAAAAKGMRALDEWQDGLTSDELSSITVTQDRAWRETAAKVSE